MGALMKEITFDEVVHGDKMAYRGDSIQIVVYLPDHQEFLRVGYFGGGQMRALGYLDDIDHLKDSNGWTYVEEP
jgi:hypothetical protein